MKRWVIVAVAVLMCGVSQAQDGRADLRERIQGKFDNMLRQRLQLSDAQEQAVMPEIHRLEEEKRRFDREKMEIVRELRVGMRDGASDDDLRAMLDRLDDNEAQRRQMVQQAMREIDADLTVRQQVQFRFFVSEFRRELRHRLGDAGPRGKRPRRQGR